MLTLGIKSGKEVGNILSPESSVAPGSDAIDPYSAGIRPASQGIGMNMKQAGYFPYCQHAVHLTVSYHVFHFLHF